jgi:hypothetical protein
MTAAAWLLQDGRYGESRGNRKPFHAEMHQQDLHAQLLQEASFAE